MLQCQKEMKIINFKTSFCRGYVKTSCYMRYLYTPIFFSPPPPPGKYTHSIFPFVLFIDDKRIKCRILLGKYKKTKQGSMLLANEIPD